MRIQRVQVDHYRIPLPVVLSDSTHGDMSHFGLATVRILTDDGIEGVGYSYVVGDIGGGALHAMLAQDLAPMLPGRDSNDRERIWHELWWRVHFVGRGGLASFALAAVDVALWDVAAKQASKPWWKLLGGWRKPVPAYAGGIDLQFPLDKLLHQADGFRDAGFRAIKMKVGRPSYREDADRALAMRSHLGDGFPLMADANMQ